MKSYDERIESIFRKYDERRAEKKRRRTLLLRSCAIGAGAAAVIGIGLTTYALRPPKKPAPSQSGIVAETETTSAETTAASTSPSTAASQTTTTVRTTATAEVTTASSARQITSTEHTTTTSARTTVTTASATAGTTFAATVSEIQTTTVSSVLTTVSAAQTTASTRYSSTKTTTTKTPASGEFPPVEAYLPYDYGMITLSENEKTYIPCGEYHNTQNIGEFVCTADVKLIYVFGIEVVNADVYSLVSADSEKAVLLKIQDKYILYRNTDYPPNEPIE